MTFGRHVINRTDEEKSSKTRKKCVGLILWATFFLLVGVIVYGVVDFQAQQDEFLNSLVIGKTYALDAPEYESELLVTSVSEYLIHGNLILILEEPVDPETFYVQRFPNSRNEISSCIFVVNYYSHGSSSNLPWDECPTMNLIPVEIDEINYRSP